MKIYQRVDCQHQHTPSDQLIGQRTCKVADPEHVNKLWLKDAPPFFHGTIRVHQDGGVNVPMTHSSGMTSHRVFVGSSQPRPFAELLLPAPVRASRSEPSCFDEEI